MADNYESKYTGEQIDSRLDDVATLDERVKAIEDALGAYIEEIDTLVGGDA